jgi:hypothetical protein
MQGKDGNRYGPLAHATRAEALTLISPLLNNRSDHTVIRLLRIYIDSLVRFAIAEKSEIVQEV